MPRLILLAFLALSILQFAGSAPAARVDAGGRANVFVSVTGNDAAAGCMRFATPQAPPLAANTCRTVGKALSLAAPGDVIQLLPGAYGSVTISRQSGRDVPKVVVRGDPAMVDQFGCAADACPLGNVTINDLSVCGHGLSIEDIDSKARDQTYVYVGDNPCPTAGGSQISANHDIELHNVHFTQGTLRGTHIGMYHSRLGPEYDICGDPQRRSDLLHIWPTADGHEPVDVTVDHSVIYGNIMSSRGCGGAHADNIQLLGVDGLTFTNNLVGRAANDDWVDGSLNGTQEHGTILIAGNFFSGGDTIAASVGVQFGLGGTGTCDANYVIRNNTFGMGRNVTLDCRQSQGTAVWTNNFLHMSTSVATTCGSGTFDSNRWDGAGKTACGRNAGICAPKWARAGANTDDVSAGWDLHLAPDDTCLRGNGIASASDTQNRDIDGDARPLRLPLDIGADQVEPASLLLGSAIGRVQLGMRRASVESRYGTVAMSQRRLRGARGKLTAAVYRVPGGAMTVAYDKGGVVGVSTSSAYYTTPDGLGVGSASGDAQRLPDSQWIPCTGAWVLRTSRAETFLSARSKTSAVGGVVILRPGVAAPTKCQR